MPGKADKAGVSEPITSRQWRPQQGAALPRGTFFREWQPGALSREARAPRGSSLLNAAPRDAGIRGRAIDGCTADTKAHATWGLESHCDSQLTPGTAFDLCPFQRRQPASWLGAPWWILKTQTLRKAAPCRLIEPQRQCRKEAQAYGVIACVTRSGQLTAPEAVRSEGHAEMDGGADLLGASTMCKASCGHVFIEFSQ